MFRYTLPLLRSPGGTPLRRHNMDTQGAADNDPASIIALALRKKFAHKVFQDSPGELVQWGFSFRLLFPLMWSMNASISFCLPCYLAACINYMYYTMITRIRIWILYNWASEASHVKMSSVERKTCLSLTLTTLYNDEFAGRVQKHHWARFARPRCCAFFCYMWV